MRGRPSVYTVWYYKGDSNTGEGDIVDAIADQSRGFLTLTLPMSLPANRTGYYQCNSIEYNVDTGNIHSKQHSIRASLPTGNAFVYETEYKYCYYILGYHNNSSGYNRYYDSGHNHTIGTEYSNSRNNNNNT